MRAVLPLVVVLFATPAASASLCGVAPAAALPSIAGAWEGGAKVSLDNETVSMLRAAPGQRFDISRDGRIAGGVLEEIGLGPRLLRPVADGRYDVDRVDDLLDATQNAELADILLDTPCGPEALPQFRATLSQSGEMSAEGTLTLIAYFDDRVLAIAEATFASTETVLFMTSTGLVRPSRDSGARDDR